MTPYYDDGQVTLYLGDCRQVAAWLEADVLVTDPPYGRAWRQRDTEKLRGWSDNSHAGIAGDEDTSLRDWALSQWGSLRAAAVFGDLLLPPPSGAKLAMAYRKPHDAGVRGAVGGFRRDLEAIYLIGGWQAGLGGRSSLLTSNARGVAGTYGTAARYGHPHAKPVDVLEQLIQACPLGGIADPFAGSGSTLVAARNLGRKAVGVEIDERYCEQAARRLSQGVLAIGEPG